MRIIRRIACLKFIKWRTFALFAQNIRQAFVLQIQNGVIITVSLRKLRQNTWFRYDFLEFTLLFLVIRH